MLLLCAKLKYVLVYNKGHRISPLVPLAQSHYDIELIYNIHVYIIYNIYIYVCILAPLLRG